MRNRLSTALLLCAAFVCQLLHAQTAITVAGFTPGSFRVTETGAASYTIAIRVPPGIAGMEPRLALAYGSQAGNGLLGAGWGLQGLSAVHRCGRTIVQDGANAGVFYDTSDKLCLDGKRLVLVLGTYGANGAEYRTERESFTKIVSYGTAGSGPESLKVWTKSGQVLEYGNTADSRIEAQGKTSVRAWALNKASDTKGNYFTITYNEDNANGEYSPSRIDYTGNGAAAPSASVRFTYESRTDNEHPIYVGLSLIKLMNRMTNVKTYVGETVVTDYRLAYNYSPNSGPSRLLSVTECTGDGAQCLSATSFAWQDPPSGTIPNNPWSGAELGTTGKLGDFNGDGMADVVYASGSDLYVRYSTGTGFGSPVYIAALPVVGTNYPDGGWPEPVYAKYMVGDFDGNGRTDIALSNGTALLSTASGFSSVSWPGYADGQLADVNGDGMADVVYASGSDLYVRYSTGTGFGSPVYIAALPVVGTNYPEGGWPEPVYAKYMVGDFDGNGRTDIALSNGTALLSTASGFSSVSWPGYADGQLADVNGDGMADVVYAIDSDLYARFSTGAGFDSPVQIGFLPIVGYSGAPDVQQFPNYAGFALGDVDGNGRADALLSSGSAVLLTSPVPDLVTSITTSLGLASTITYKPLTDSTVYTNDTDAVWPVRDLKQQGPLYVVSSVSVPNLVGGNMVTDYFYRGAKAHLRGGGFLGFRQVEASDASTLIKTVSTSRQDYPYQGLPIQVVRKQSSGTVIAQSDSTYTDTALTPAAGSGGMYHKVERTQAVERSYELGGALTVKATTATTYDGFGNAASITVSTAVSEGTGDGYSKITTNTYTNDVTNWFLGRLTRSTVLSTIP